LVYQLKMLDAAKEFKPYAVELMKKKNNEKYSK
jgi:hypothetical protein